MSAGISFPATPLSRARGAYVFCSGKPAHPATNACSSDKPHVPDVSPNYALPQDVYKRQDLQRIAREVINRISYTKSEYMFEGNSCCVFSAIHEQSADINRGVEREDPMNPVSYTHLTVVMLCFLLKYPMTK